MLVLGIKFRTIQTFSLKRSYFLVGKTDKKKVNMRNIVISTVEAIK